ncbi:selenoprotein K-like [Watersipora subatra]|uniref:selenoprotein K-like n=1 Tax=Watersipora subatra TaxID=2589382 RepID=UPI00355B6679
MVYVSRGQVCQSRPWSLETLHEMLWGFINFIVLFFRTMVTPDLTSKGRNTESTYRAGNSGRGPRGPPPGPRKRMGGFGGGSGSPSPPPMGGG